MTAQQFVSNLEQILGVPPGSLKMGDGPNTVKSWDSMATVTILASIDQDLGIELSEDLIKPEMTVGELVQLLEQKQAFRG
jgi:acyl carrier protein